jgi:membrane protein implicated in regulation of membrane protease activity
MKSRRIIAVLVGGIVLIAAAILVFSDSRANQIGGVSLLVAFLVLSLIWDWFEAWSNERHVKENPHLLKNDAIGERVTVSGKFYIDGGVATGVVVLSGVKWKARCPAEHLPEDGEILRVESRDGLTLLVSPKNSND